MIKHSLTLILALLFIASKSQATVTIGIQADELRDSGVTALTSTSLFLLVSSTSDANFDAIIAGASTAIGSSLNGGDDRIVFRGDLQSSFANYSAAGVLDVTATGLDLSSVSGWSSNDPLALLWFPTLTTASATIDSSTPYGIYTNAAAIDGSAAWVTPSDTSSVNIGFYTTAGLNLGPGTNSASTGSASLTVAGVPEPSRSLLALIGFGVLTLRRRR